MEIVKFGDFNFNRRRAFKCGMCDCVFIADAREYEVRFVRAGKRFETWCPCCGESVNEPVYIMRGDEELLLN